MRKIGKVITAVLVAAMIMGTAMSVYANTLISVTDSGSTDVITIVQKDDKSGYDYTFLSTSEAWERDLEFADYKSFGDGTYQYSLINGGTKDHWVNLLEINNGTRTPIRTYTLIAGGTAGGSSSDSPIPYYCTHEGASWINDNNATENSECTKSLVCPHCGAILSQTAVYGTAFLAFNNRVAEAVKAAPAGSEVVASTKRWNTVNADVLKAIDARDDVTVRFEYIRPNDGWTAITIPAGSDCAGLANEEGFAGFEYLIQQFGSEKIQ